MIVSLPFLPSAIKLLVSQIKLSFSSVFKNCINRSPLIAVPSANLKCSILLPSPLKSLMMILSVRSENNALGFEGSLIAKIKSSPSNLAIISFLTILSPKTILSFSPA